MRHASPSGAAAPEALRLAVRAQRCGPGRGGDHRLHLPAAAHPRDPVAVDRPAGSPFDQPAGPAAAVLPARPGAARMGAGGARTPSRTGCRSWSGSCWPRASSSGARSCAAQLPRVLELETPHGPARAHLHAGRRRPRRARARPRRRRRGRRAGPRRRRPRPRWRRACRSRSSSSPTASPGASRRRPAPQLDAAWTAVVEQLPRRRRGCRCTSAAARQARAWPAGRRRRPARRASSASRSRCTRPGGRRRRGCPSSSR